MLAGIMAVRNVAGESHDVWAVNVEQEYLEEGDALQGQAADRLVPARVAGAGTDDLLQAAFAKYDSIALGGALAVVIGLGLFLATALLLIQGGDSPGPMLSVLGSYFLGFRVTWSGAFLGLAYFDLLYHLVALTVLLRVVVEKEIREAGAETVENSILQRKDNKIQIVTGN